MPCDTIQRVQVDLGKLDPTTLIAALTTMGLSPFQSGHYIHFGNGEYYDTRNGANSRLAESRDVNEIKQSYSAEVVKSQAKKYGWALRETGKYQYEVIRR